jgi:hypothetical protein
LSRLGLSRNTDRRTAAQNCVTSSLGARIFAGRLSGGNGSGKVGARVVVWRPRNLRTTGSGKLNLTGAGFQY